MIHKAQPYDRRANFSDVFSAYGTALADLISGGSFPESYNDFSSRLPNQFIDSLERYENRFHKLEGFTINEDLFLRVGQIWIGKFGDLSFDSSYTEGYDGRNLEALRLVFNGQTSIISGGRLRGTSDRASLENSFRCELGLGILALLLNMTYQGVFSKLSILRRIERPEQGISKQFSFGFYGAGAKSRPSLTLSTKFIEPGFNIDGSIVDYWEDSLSMSELSKIMAMEPEQRNELQAKLVKAILYFRQASLQTIPEMQLSTLWVCVESILTTGEQPVLESNIPTLLAISDWLLPAEHWPDNSQSLDQLERTLKRYYSSRSRTFHYGSVGHVTKQEVQQFSLVVCNLIVAITHLAEGRCTTTKGMVRASKSFLNSSNRNR